EDTDARRVSRVLVLEERRGAALVIGLLAHLHRPNARAIDGEQQVVVGLEMDRTGVGRAGEEGHRLRALGIAHVDDRDAVREAMADIGIAAVDHDLNAVATAALVAVGEEADVARGDGGHGCSVTLWAARSRRGPGPWSRG